MSGYGTDFSTLSIPRRGSLDRPLPISPIDEETLYSSDYSKSECRTLLIKMSAWVIGDGPSRSTYCP